MRSVFGRLSLKPYGDELLTPGADFWIFSARLIVFTMAAAEAMAWGFMGSLMSREYPWVTAAVAATFVFILIWIIDATFITLDLTGKRLKLAGGVVARVAIVSASLFITAPFLAQAIFAGDVRDEMQRRNANLIASKRGEIDRGFATRIASLQREQKALEEQRVLEAAGLGPSGRYGRGPALQTIERQLDEKRAEIAAAETSRRQSLDQFDRLSPQQIETLHGVPLVKEGVQSSGQVLDDLLETPQYTSGELAVRAFLAFLFIGLLILKAFQPRSVGVYYNEKLHSVYNGEKIDPLQFEEWCNSSYAVIQWQRLETMARAELDPLQRRFDAAAVEMARLEDEANEASSAAVAITGELQQLDATTESMTEHIRRGSPGFEQVIAAHKGLEEKRAKRLHDLRSHERTVARCRHAMELRRAEAETLRTEIASRQSVIADAQKRIGDHRLELAEAVSRQS